MHLTILSRQKPIFSREVKSITLPGSVAPFQVLPKHMNLMTTLTQGRITYHSMKGEIHHMTIQHGIAQVKDDKVIALVETESPMSVFQK